MDLINVVEVTIEIGECVPFESIDLTKSDEENTEITLQIGTDNVKVLDNDDIMLQCTNCQTLFIHAIPFIEHVIEHELNVIKKTDEPFNCICEHCGIMFEDYCTFQKHYASHTKAYCDKCNIKFESEDELIKHERSHDVNSSSHETYRPKAKTYADKRRVCKICQTKFTNLKRHVMITHEVAGPFSCWTCKQVFEHSTAVQEHLKSNLTCLKPFVCQCDKRFSSHSALKKHQTMHSDERPYVCDVCSFSFKTKERLCRHMKIQEGKRRFKCKNCMKKFGKKCDLRKHELKNCCEAPYTCQICSAKFKKRKILNNHLFIHRDERVFFGCDECGYEADSKEGISRHLKMHASK